MAKIFDKNHLDEAAKLLQAGELIAFPTETVFGLGAIANQERAVEKVFALKGRPQDNPLIVHVYTPQQCFSLTTLNAQQKEIFLRLTEKFWPGPLTLVVPIKEGVLAPAATGGLATVGFRMPAHPLTLTLIEKVGFPLVGPSANISGKPSPTSVDHVLHDFPSGLGGIIDSKPTEIGVESTVLSLCEEPYPILRPGAITYSDLVNACPETNFANFKKRVLGEKEIPMAPGMKYRHYSPEKPVIAVAAQKIASVLDRYSEQKMFCAAKKNTLENLTIEPKAYMFNLGDTDEEATHNLFKALREADSYSEIDLIVVEMLPNKEHNLAYRNRLEKASVQIIE